MSETGDTMLSKQSPFRIFFEKFDRELMRLRADQRGNIAVMMGFLLPVLVGFLGLGFEVSQWYLQTRYMQNAADSAVLAAATTAVRNTTNPSAYVGEAKAVTAKYGFVDGTNNVTVVPLNKQPCPSPSDGNNCYTVTITSRVQLWLSQVVGYAGDWTVSGVKGKKLSSAATALTPTAPLCLLALNTTGTAFQANGGPKTDFTNCTIMSNSGATCNGSNLNATYGIAVGANGGGTGCGIGQTSNYPTPDLTPGCAEGRCYSTILANADGGQMSNAALALCNNNYPQVPTGGKNKGVWPTQLSALSQLPSFTGSDGTVYYVACGDTQLSGSITTPNALGGTPGYALVVENGNLDLGNYTLEGPALSVVFSGTNSPTYGHAVTTGSGTNSFLDIHAPASGDWSGVALYQDPLVAGVPVTYAGNSPTWNINGLVYLPKSDLTISGAIGKSAYGGDCMVMVAGSVLINGTGSIYSQDPAGQACPQEGLIQDHVIAGRPAELVY